jgi:NADPH:quinone reductase-like Zn-dependent oxidoreductase
MDAMRYTRYGSPAVLQRDRVEAPPLGATDVLIQLHAAAANAGDWHLLHGGI